MKLLLNQMCNSTARLIPLIARVCRIWSYQTWKESKISLKLFKKIYNIHNSYWHQRCYQLMSEWWKTRRCTGHRRVCISTARLAPTTTFVGDGRQTLEVCWIRKLRICAERPQNWQTAPLKLQSPDLLLHPSLICYTQLCEESSLACHTPQLLLQRKLKHFCRSTWPGRRPIGLEQLIGQQAAANTSHWRVERTPSASKSGAKTLRTCHRATQPRLRLHCRKCRKESCTLLSTGASGPAANCTQAFFVLAPCLQFAVRSLLN